MSDPFGFDLPGLRADEEDVALKAPEGMCDGHVEIFGSRDKYPLDPRSDETPPEMPLDAYREAREALLVKPVKDAGLDQARLSELAAMLRVLSGYYDQATRSAASL